MSRLITNSIRSTSASADAITLDGSGNATFPANVTCSGTATGFTIAASVAKAWANINGVGTVAIRSSYNVSSITDNGTGDYTVNFTNNMPNTNYIVVGFANRQNSRVLTLSGETFNRDLSTPYTNPFTVSSARISTFYQSGNNGESNVTDADQLYLVFYGG